MRIGFGIGLGVGGAPASTPPPTVTSISPSSGTMAGGTPVTITGTNLTAASVVSVNGVALTGISVGGGGTTITGTTAAASSAGTGTVSVTTPAGTGTKSNGWTYLPFVTSATPNNGTAAGGTSVVLAGAGFTSASAVTFNGVSQSFHVDSDTQITVASSAAASAAATGNIVVTTPVASATKTNGWTYNPCITSLSVSSGPARGGTAVTVNGVGLTGATAVTLNGVAQSFVVTNDTTITIASTAAAGSAATGNVVVTIPSGTLTVTNGWTYTFDPSLASLALWARSDLGVTSSTTFTWADQSSNGRNLTATGSARPTYAASGGFNNRPKITFDGIANILATASFTLANPITVWVVMKQLGWTINHIVWSASTSPFSPEMFQASASPNISLYAGSVPGVSDTNLTLNNYGWVRAICDGASSSLCVGTHTATSMSIGTNSLTGGFSFGGLAGASFSNIEVAEVIITNGHADATLIANMNTYFQNLYGASV